MKKRILTLASAAVLAIVPAFAQQQQGPKPKSKAEGEALQKVKTAAATNDPQATLTAISNVLENYTDTEFKPMLLAMAIQAAQQTNDTPTTVTWCERAIQADPNNIDARVSMADTIAAGIHEHDLDKDQNIAKATKNANEALDLLKNANTPPSGFGPDQWPAYKAHLNEQAYDSLGLVADVKKDYPEAIKQFEAAAAAEPSNPLPQARLSKAYNENKQYDQAMAAADKVMANTEALPQVKSFAQSQKNFAEKMKGSASK